MALRPAAEAAAAARHQRPDLRVSRGEAGRFGVALLFLAIVAFGTFLRLDAVDWDGLAGLHPDERHMIFRVEASLRGLGQTLEAAGPDGRIDWMALWFDSAASPLNPRNDPNGDVFYVYGDLPHLIGTFNAWLRGVEGWANQLVAGRELAGLFDSLTILVVFLTALLWGRSERVALAAALFYASLPIAVQGAHFFTVEPFLAFFAALSLLGLALATERRSFGGWLLAGLGAGAAVACKISAVLLAPAFLVAAILGMRGLGGTLRVLLGLLLAGLAAAVTLRLASPFLFAGPGLADAMPSPRFVASLEALAGQAENPLGAPPGWFWVDRMPVLYPLRDLVLIGFGPALVIALLLGLARMTRRPRGALVAVAVLVPVVGTMLVHVAPALRYALPAGAAAAVIAGLAVGAPLRPARALLALACIGFAAVQGDAIRRMLEAPHPRIAASIWIWENMAEGSLIVNETAWDDGLPVPLLLPDGQGQLWPNAPIGPFETARLEIDHPPSVEKIAHIAETLAAADLVVESSARMSGTIPRLGDFRPVGAAYYRLRDAGELCLREVARFDQGLPLLDRFEIDDAWAQEPWSVYDHPTVRLFTATECMSAETIVDRLTPALTGSDPR